MAKRHLGFAAGFALLLLAAPARADALATRLAELAEAAVAEDGLIGIVMGVGRPGQAPALAAAGVAELNGAVPMRPESAFKIASIAKTFTVALTLQLEAEGRLALDDKLQHFLPDVPNAAQVSLRQLLNHSAGYPDYITDAFADAAHKQPGKRWRAEELLAFAQPERLDFAPGTRFDYSNTNYLLLRMALDAVLGRAELEDVQRRFLAPLGLAHTWFAAADAVPAEAVVHGYANLDDSGKLSDATAEPAALGGADGAAVSTVPDLLRWAAALYGGTVLAPAQRKEMLSFPQLTDDNGVLSRDYGLGVERIGLDGVTFYGHSGSAPGYTSMMLYEPATRVAIALAFNEDPSGEALLDILAERMLHAVEESGAARFPRTPEAQPALKE